MISYRVNILFKKVRWYISKMMFKNSVSTIGVRIDLHLFVPGIDNASSTDQWAYATLRHPFILTWNLSFLYNLKPNRSFARTFFHNLCFIFVSHLCLYLCDCGQCWQLFLLSLTLYLHASFFTGAIVSGSSVLTIHVLTQSPDLLHPSDNNAVHF